MTKITFKTAVALFDQIVDEIGADTLYEERAVNLGEPYMSDIGCRYQIGGVGACIVGIAFDKLHIPYDSRWEGNIADAVIDDYISEYEFTPKAQAFISRLQAEQDTGTRWGEAVGRAKNVASRF